MPELELTIGSSRNPYAMALIDGSVQPTGHFQLFYVNLAPPPPPSPTATPRPGATPNATQPTPTPVPTPPVSRQLTLDQDFDATSAPVWF